MEVHQAGERPQTLLHTFTFCEEHSFQALFSHPGSTSWFDQVTAVASCNEGHHDLALACYDEDGAGAAEGESDCTVRCLGRGNTH